MANRFWVGGSANWDATAGSKWALTSGGAGGQAVPTSSDNVFLDSSSGAVTVNIVGPVTCLDLTCTGFTGTLTGSGGLTISGNMTFVSGMTMTYGGSKTFNGSATQTITSAGKQFTGTCIISNSVTWILADDFYNDGTTVFNGATVDANGHNITMGILGCSNTTVNMGSGTWSFTHNGTQTIWNGAPTTLNAGTSLLKLLAPVVSQQPSISADGVTFYDVLITGVPGGGGSEWQFLGATGYSFHNFTIDTGGGGLMFTSGATITIQSGGSFAVSGSAGNLNVIHSETPGSSFTITKSSGTVICDYISLQDSAATGGAAWYAGAHSTNVSGNSGWTFSTPTTTSTSSSSISTSSSSSSSISTSSSSSTVLTTTYMIGADTNGDVQLINNGTSDDGVPIYYELETQELEFGNRSHLKGISDQIVVFTRNGDSSSLQAREDDGDYKNIPVALNRTVNIGKDIQLEGHYFTFRWFGETSTETPIFEGLYLENIEDKGMTYE